MRFGPKATYLIYARGLPLVGGSMAVPPRRKPRILRIPLSERARRLIRAYVEDKPIPPRMLPLIARLKQRLTVLLPIMEQDLELLKKFLSKKRTI